MNQELQLFSGSAHRKLGERIAQFLNIPLGEVELRRFADGEIGVQYNENIRGRDVFIVQPTCPPADNLLELLIMVDA
ncbi:ribose-phosphate pyrophosphokinase-like domain-containing protein, partial [bacterium]|nr:ribose-phosphate pyrophosphokinase-like domain-containing protein [bacterium]